VLQKSAQRFYSEKAALRALEKHKQNAEERIDIYEIALLLTLKLFTATGLMVAPNSDYP